MNNAVGLRGYKKRIFVIGAVLFILFNVFVASLVRSNDNQYMAGTMHPAGMMFTGEIVHTSLEGTTGKLFTGETVPKYSEPKMRNSPMERVFNEKRGSECEHWAVLMTSREHSEAVRRQVKLHNWCLVIVSDTKTRTEYQTGWVKGEGNNKVVVLTTENQEHMSSLFVNAIPSNHFGRKNIGYLYAIMHGASVIWDFDDDHMLKFWIPGAAPDGAPSLAATVNMVLSKGASDIDTLEPQGHDWPVFNPYPALGAPALPLWPRGLPFIDTKKPQCSNTTIKGTFLPTKSVAVLQSLADVQPDVDAIFRVTVSTPRPFAFKRTDETRPLMIPNGVLTPYNAQATLHFKSAFWALLLPITVHRQVSDIWRSYIAQRLFWDCDLQVGFVARPLVVQDRRAYNDLNDIYAERDLYVKSEHLVKFLGSWKGIKATLEERIEELWIALYEHQYIELKDVELIRYWLQSLHQAGYIFPEVKHRSLYVPTYTESTTKDSTVWLQSLHQAGYTFPEVKPSPAYVPMYTESTTTDSSYYSSCKTSRSLTFWTSDLHNGTRMDMPSVLGNFGHRVILAGHKGRQVPHPVLKQVKEISVYTRLSNTIKTFRTPSTALTESMVEENFEFYKNDEQISLVDAFICSFPASMCEMWMPFNKTIIFAPAHRYNLGRCTKGEFLRLNEHLSALASSVNPHHVIAALSHYDEEYLRHYTGLSVAPLYSYSGFYTLGHRYNPTRPEILVFGWDDRFREEITEFKLVYTHKLYRRYELSDLVSHRAIVYRAYSVMSYKLTEFYSLAIPLFMPSMKFYQKVHSFGKDRSSLSAPYCKNPRMDKNMKPHPSSIHPYSPNIQGKNDLEAEYYWLQFSDFYYWPHITYFDNFTDLELKLKQADFNKIHMLMVQEVERKKAALLDTWCKVLKRVQTEQNVPKDYKTALMKLYNTSRLQVK